MVNISVIFFSFFIFYQIESSLEVSITGITAAEGMLRIGIYQKQHKFIGDEGYFFKEIPVTRLGTVNFKVPVPSGSYAISVYHDLNNDKELNTNLIGIPKEPYGFSKAMSSFGPPSFEEASFTIPETKEIAVAIK